MWQFVHVLLTAAIWGVTNALMKHCSEEVKQVGFLDATKRLWRQGFRVWKQSDGKTKIAAAAGEQSMISLSFPLLQMLNWIGTIFFHWSLGGALPLRAVVVLANGGAMVVGDVMDGQYWSWRKAVGLGTVIFGLVLVSWPQ